MSGGVPFRTIARKAVFQYLGRFKVGHQDRLRAVHLARPSTFQALPAAYVGSIADVFRFPGSVRQRDASIEVVLVGDNNIENDLVVVSLDALADDLIDELSQQRHLLYDGVHLRSGDSIQEPRTAQGGELDIGGVLYPAVFVTLLGHLEESIQ